MAENAIIGLAVSLILIVGLMVIYLCVAAGRADDELEQLSKADSGDDLEE